MIRSREIPSPTGRGWRALLLPRVWVSMLLISGSAVLLWAILETTWISDVTDFVERYSPIVVIMEIGQELLLALGYPGLVLIIFTENVFPPIPSDVVLPLAGFTAATTPMLLFGVIVATTLGSLLGALTLYALGLLLGEDRVRRVARRFGKYLTFEEAELDRSLDWFRRHGSVVVMVARVIPVFRSLISIPAGMVRMPLGRFLGFTAIGAGFWNTSLIMAGYLLGSNWNLVVSWLDTYQFAMLALNVGLVAVVGTLRVRTYRRRRAAERV